MRETKTATYVGWEEVFASNEKGKPEVRYYLKRVDGKEDLVIVGKEMDARGMAYRYVMKGSPSCDLKMSCRRDVVDWVQSVISGNQPSDSIEQSVVNMGSKLDASGHKGRRKQETLKKTPSLTSELSDDDLRGKGSIDNAVVPRPGKRIRLCEGFDLHSHSMDKGLSPIDAKEGTVVNCPKENGTNASMSVGYDTQFSDLIRYITIGSQVEVLGQDTGIRGCWFRGLIIEKIKNKVKVRYQDRSDTINRNIHLEEWMSLFRLALPDELLVRAHGRTMVRPFPPLGQIKASCGVNVGSMVDAWWYDGWWEGIVVKKESEEKFIVYFSGEKHEMIFNLGDLRHSMEWVNSSWQYVRARPELVPYLCGLEKEPKAKKISESDQNGLKGGKENISSGPPKNAIKINLFDLNKPSQSAVRDLSRDDLLVRLRWKSSGKKRTRRGKCGNVSKETQSAVKCSMKSRVNSDAEKCKDAIDPSL